MKGRTCAPERSSSPPPPDWLVPTTRTISTFLVELPPLICSTQEYVPAGNPVAYAETLTAPGVVPPEELSDTHDPPYTAAVKVIGDPVLLTEMVFAEGVWEPSAKNTSRDVLTVSVPPLGGGGGGAGVVEVTVNVTGIVFGLLDAVVEVITTEPLYVPAFNPVGFTAALTLPGVVPPPLAVNQLPPDIETV
jgi:hypothetical protein